MSRRMRCGPCDGRGYPLEIGSETCPHCVGTGRDIRSILWSEQCRHCPNACGRISFNRRSQIACTICNGRGWVLY